MKNAPNVLWTVVAAVILISIFINGMQLPGAPKARNVSRITVAYPAVTEGEQEFTDEESIEKACDLLDSLKYIPFRSVKDRQENPITINYYLTNGSTKTVTADAKSVFWGGKLCALKDPGTFMQLAAEAFFAEG